jgi:hypothetical protein
MAPLRAFVALTLGALLSGAHAPTAAQGFAALVSPPRFELSARPGTTQRALMEITNGGSQAARYRFRTADWSLGPEGQVTILEDLQPGSCRPWVAIERAMADVPSGGRLRYRFEVTPPADAPAGECRFAVLVEGDEPAVASGENFKLPVRGRIGVIVYVTVGDASPKLEVEKSGFATFNGKRTPTVFVRNAGTAHGRLSGFLTGTDAKGQRFDITPSGLPILPGETRAIALTAANDRNEPIELPLPITIRGNLEWSGGRLPFEHRFE